jgi:hypothetical protein
MCICFVPPNQVQTNVGQLLKIDINIWWPSSFSGYVILVFEKNQVPNHKGSFNTSTVNN